MKRASCTVAFVALFLSSVALRLPDLGEPLSTRQLSTGMALVTLLNWESQGAIQHRFCLLQSFPLEADKFVRNAGMRMLSDVGNGYYVSMPPFAIILPYLVFQLFSVPVHLLSLQIFNLFFHGLTAFVLLTTLRRALAESPARELAALLGAAVYLFSPPALWYFGVHYSWDVFWHYPWILCIWLSVGVWQQAAAGKSIKGYLWAFGAAHFLAVYSEFQALFFSGTAVLAAVLWLRPVEAARRLVPVVLGTAIAAVFLALLQYTWIDGLESLFETMSQRAGSRSIVGIEAGDFGNLIHRHERIFRYSILALLAMLVVGASWRDRSARMRFSRDEKLLLLLTTLPVFAHGILFVQWASHHDYTLMKFTVFIAFAVAVVTNAVFGVADRGWIPRIVVSLCLLAFFWSSIARFTGEYRRPARGTEIFELGESIREMAAPDEVVFAVAERRITAPVIYHSRRNIETISSPEDARAWLQQHGRERGLIVFTNRKYHLEHWERIEAGTGESRNGPERQR